MIRGVRANKRGFRQVSFDIGANIILADRSQSAGDKDTTNALGKSTLIEIIDFCLGANSDPRKGLRVEALEGWSFTLDLTLRGSDVAVTRSVLEPGFIEIEGNTTDWVVSPKLDKEGICGFELKAWRAVLAWALFGLPENKKGQTYRPSARSLLSYFTRGQPSAYNSPFKFFENQKVWEVQVYNAFLLGLDWEKATAWQRLKDQRNALDALKKAIKTGAIDGELATLGELEAERVQLQNQQEREAKALASFHVLPQYREIEAQANRLTAELHVLVNANIVDNRRIARYRDVAGEEEVPDQSRLEALYQEAGIVLPGSVTKTLAEARAFNNTIIKNRQRFVVDELTALENAVAERQQKVAALSDERVDYMSALAGHGALEEMTSLQELHLATRAKVNAVINRIAQLRQMTTKADLIKVETVDLKRSAETDYEERREVWSQALTLFSEYSEALYKAPGRLVIDIDDTGYRFDVEIDGSPSEGISKMKVFCYDLMLISFARIRGLGIDFLIHDSTVFDGVDPRQRAHALELADMVSRKYGFQYICTLNTDMMPLSDFTSGFDHQASIRMRLTDTDPSGSLLGFRY